MARGEPERRREGRVPSPKTRVLASPRQKDEGGARSSGQEGPPQAEETAPPPEAPSLCPVFFISGHGFALLAWGKRPLPLPGQAAIRRECRLGGRGSGRVSPCRPGDLSLEGGPDQRVTLPAPSRAFPSAASGPATTIAIPGPGEVSRASGETVTHIPLPNWAFGGSGGSPMTTKALFHRSFGLLTTAVPDST